MFSHANKVPNEINNLISPQNIHILKALSWKKDIVNAKKCWHH